MATTNAMTHIEKQSQQLSQHCHEITQLFIYCMGKILIQTANTAQAIWCSASDMVIQNLLVEDFQNVTYILEGPPLFSPHLSIDNGLHN